MNDSLVVSFFLTDNRVSPVVAMIGDWPSSSRLAQSCRKGLLVCRRYARPDERVGGLTFWRLGRFGGSFYVSRVRR